MFNRNWRPSGKAARRIAGDVSLFAGSLFVGLWLASFFASCPKNLAYTPGADSNSALDNAAIYDSIVLCNIRSFNAWLWRFAYAHHHAIEVVLGIVFTGAIAVFTGTLWWSTRKLWGAGERQLRVSKQQALIAAHTAKASRKAADIAEKALLANSRPWVGVSLIEIAKPLNAANIKKTRVELKNFGQTPAIQLRGEVHGAIREKSEGIPTLPVSIDPRASRITLFPGATHNYFPFINMTAATDSQVSAIENDTVLLCATARFEYLDTGGQKHSTTVRGAYNAHTKGFSPTSDSNEAD